jgi:hypothetical protein
VVVVELAGAAGVVVVVELVVAAGVLSFTLVQADSVARAAAIRHGIISFFISIIVVWFVTLRAQNYAIG